jgi:hypothetical protein
MHALVANLLCRVQNKDGEWVFYSRDNDHYAGLTRYCPKFYRRLPIVVAVDRLESLGLFEHDRTAPSPFALYRSRIRAIGKLRALGLSLAAGATRFCPRETIVLRGEDRKPRPYRETNATYAMRRDVMAHNAFLDRFEITLEHPDAHYDEHNFLVVGGQRFNPMRRAYYRVFNLSFARGGRWFGPWWQSVSSRIRGGIRIDGAPTIEEDFHCCHLRLLCALAGVELGDGDAYGGLDLPRDEVKLALNIMLNASNWHVARGALLGRLGVHGPAALARASQLRKAVKARFPALARFWNTGYGLKLQNIDASICMKVQRRLREHGIACLSVHDSFIVPARDSSQLRDLMGEEFANACRRLRLRS